MTNLYFTFILLLAAICEKACAQDDKEFEKVYNECLAEHNVSESEAPDMHNIIPDTTNVDMKLKCFAYCIIKKRGYLDENDKLIADKFSSVEVIDDCKAMHDMTDDPCQYVFDIYNCIAK